MIKFTPNSHSIFASKHPITVFSKLYFTQRTLKMARSALDEMSESGAFIRSPSTFRSFISRDPNSTFPAESGRYHLYVSYARPWASRCLAYLKIKGLDKTIDFTDGDIKNAIEDAGFEAEILQEQPTTKAKSHGTLVGQFIIGGMTCAACVNSLEGILRKLPGVKRAIVALATSLGEVEYDPLIISKNEILNAIEDAGFEASLAQSSGQDRITLGVNGIYSDLDVHMLNDMLYNMKGVRQFTFNKTSSELDVLFDTEILGPS